MGFINICTAKNHSVCLYIMWTSILCLVYSVNSIVWDNNVANGAPVWCDISSHLITAGWCGSQTGLLCIVRCLYRIMTKKTVDQSSRQAQLDLVIDLCIGIDLPLLILALQYIVDSKTFAIFENIGCFPATILTPAAISLYAIWHSIFGLVSVLYTGLTIRAAINRKAHNMEAIGGTQHLQFSHYWRLLAHSGIGIACTLPFALVNLILASLQGPMTPFTWKPTHEDFSQICQVPISEWTNNAADKAIVSLTFVSSDALISITGSQIWGLCTLGSRCFKACHQASRWNVSYLHVTSATLVESHVASRQISTSVTYTSRFRQLSPLTLPPNLSPGERWRSHVDKPNRGLSAAPVHGETWGATHYGRNGLALPPILVRPTPVWDASFLRRHSSDLPIPSLMQTPAAPSVQFQQGLQ